MKITCLNGYFNFRETSLGEIAEFNSIFSSTLTAKDDYYTFNFLKDAPEYAIAGSKYLNLVATKTYSAKPWEIMRENKFVYDFNLKALTVSSLVAKKVLLTRLRDRYSASGLIQPGSVTSDWKRISGYQGTVNLENLNFSYSEIFYES